MRFIDVVEINPSILMKKGEVYPFVEMANLGNNCREPLLVESKIFSSGVKFQDGDSVFARIEPCLQNGKKFYCHNIGVGFGSTEYLVFRPKGNHVDNMYLYYLLQTEHIRKSMINSMTGATGRQRVNNDVFKTLEIVLPPIDKQIAIGRQLSSFDDLIENNQKQIKLLEEAAQRLYKEWFVDLRFPGYENALIVDGVPEGWRVEELGNIAVLKAGGDRPKVFSKERTTECSVPVFSNGTENEGLYGFTNNAEVTEDCVTISARGSVGYTCLRKTAFVPIVRLIAVIPNQVDVEYLFYFLKNMVFESNGAAQQQITVPMIKGKQIIIPSNSVMELFIKQIRPMMEYREVLKCKISTLVEARDRLLPKLMKGEIEV